jgi:biotin-dependent carboxylase-like uncharacterized protein
MRRGAIEVVRPGALTTVQDRGRRGLAHLGVPASGALDLEAHDRANRLVGNDATDATLETTADGVALRFDEPAVVAVTGAAATVRLDGVAAAWSLPVHLRAGAVLDVGAAQAGLRCYVAVAGGIEVPPVLGSRSTDLLSGLGPAPLVAGQRLSVGTPRRPPPAVDLAPYRLAGDEVVLSLHPGPRRDWVTGAGWASLFSGRYRVSPLSNRVALRLDGGPLERARTDELPSEGIVWGAVQLLGSGELLVFLADHPTTGGYPVIAVVDRSGESDCAQARPGSAVRLRPAGGGGGWS